MGVLGPPTLSYWAIQHSLLGSILVLTTAKTSACSVRTTAFCCLVCWKSPPVFIAARSKCLMGKTSIINRYRLWTVFPKSLSPPTDSFPPHPQKETLVPQRVMLPDPNSVQGKNNHDNWLTCWIRRHGYGVGFFGHIVPAWALWNGLQIHKHHPNLDHYTTCITQPWLSNVSSAYPMGLSGKLRTPLVHWWVSHASIPNKVTVPQGQPERWDIFNFPTSPFCNHAQSLPQESRSPCPDLGSTRHLWQGVSTPLPVPGSQVHCWQAPSWSIRQRGLHLSDSFLKANESPLLLITTLRNSQTLNLPCQDILVTLLVKKRKKEKEAEEKKTWGQLSPVWVAL